MFDPIVNYGIPHRLRGLVATSSISYPDKARRFPQRVGQDGVWSTISQDGQGRVATWTPRLWTSYVVDLWAELLTHVNSRANEPSPSLQDILKSAIV